MVAWCIMEHPSPQTNAQDAAWQCGRPVAPGSSQAMWLGEQILRHGARLAAEASGTVHALQQRRGCALPERHVRRSTTDTMPGREAHAVTHTEVCERYGKAASPLRTPNTLTNKQTIIKYKYRVKPIPSRINDYFFDDDDDDDE